MGYHTLSEALRLYHEFYGVARHKTEKKEVSYDDKEQGTEAVD